MTARKAFIAALVAACVAAPAFAQTKITMGKGDQLRFSLRGREGTYILDDVTPEALIVRPLGSAELRIASLADIKKLEMRVVETRGSSAIRGAKRGFFIGFVLGFVAGYAAAYDECNDAVLCADAAGEGLLGGIMIAPSTALMGALWRALRPASEWQRIDLPVQIELRPAEGSER